jgi:tetratricopeptide (TPR) repeat protein
VTPSLLTQTISFFFVYLVKYHLMKLNWLYLSFALSSEQFEQAVESYKSSLQVKKGRSDVTAGSIAGTHLMIALALELIPDEGESMKQAIGHVDEAIELMKAQLGRLTKQLEGHTTRPDGAGKPTELIDNKKDGNASADSLKLEIEETQSLIGELEAKREELKTIPQAPPMTEADKALQAYLAAVNSNPSTANGKGAINDLTSLVKKRARPADSSSAAQPSTSSSTLPPADTSNPVPETPSKKAKTSNLTAVP